VQYRTYEACESLFSFFFLWPRLLHSFVAIFQIQWEGILAQGGPMSFSQERSGRTIAHLSAQVFSAGGLTELEKT
jgi:hypothetical protein